MLQRFSRYLFLTCVSLFFGYNFANDQPYARLPFCEDFVQPAVFVSTLDGKLSALDYKGTLLWNIETGPGPLLTSNIHKLELTNNGQWVRIIPSLTGSLYKFNGKTIDAIPITADNLLKSSFLYSDDLVIAGGREVRTYGISLSSGEHIYECNMNGCKNITNNPNSNVDNIVVIERSTITVRAHEPRTGSERWNFSVGLHNIKIPHASCINLNPDVTKFNLSAILPEGIVTAKIEQGQVLWTHQFDSPIVNVWKWDGRDIVTVNLFDYAKPSETLLSPAIYVGMHNKQLYIHESELMQTTVQLHIQNPSSEVIESHSIAKIPWKPIPAASLTAIPSDYDETTSLSVLYSSEYVNGNGYYLYTEKDLDKRNKLSCNNSQYILPNSSDGRMQPMKIFLAWWKEIIAFVVMVVIVLNGRFTFLSNRQQNATESKEENSTGPLLPLTEKERTLSESSDAPFVSRFVNDFETVRCLGKGGFGIVFEVKQKIDECGYAIKRITLPKEQKSKDRVMREVKTLAKFEHKHIVRYFNSWTESPPAGWQKEHDCKWIKDLNYSFTDVTSEPVKETTKNRLSHKRNNSTVIDMNCGTVSFKLEDETLSNPSKDCTETSNDIIFQNGFDDTTGNTLDELDKSLERVKCISNSKDDGIVFEASSNGLPGDDDKTEEFSKDLEVLPRKNSKVKSYAPEFLYIQMQLCQKDSLKEWLSANKTRNRHDIFNIFNQIIEAVHYVHNQNLIHRDLKPGNIFFSIDGNIKVGDFGLVTEMQECDLPSDTHSSNSLMKSHTKDAGTRLYMSPEQINGLNYNYKVDIYSLGMIFFELLVPFSTEMERHHTLNNLRNSMYPEGFSEQYKEEANLLNSMLSECPDNRPTTLKIKEWPPLLKHAST